MNHSTTLILVRNGEVDGIDPPRFRGRSDLPLAQRGVRQAELTRDYLCTFGPIAAIYASPLARCQHTAHIIGAPHEVAFGYESGLIDLDYGQWQGRSYDEVERNDPEAFKAWMNTPHTAKIPGGEGLLAADRRAAAVWSAVLELHPGATTILVSHSSITRLLLLKVLCLSVRSYWELEPSPCGVSLITLKGRLWKVESMNETAHLVGQRTPVSGLAATANEDGQQMDVARPSQVA